ncbi:hypothetical protein CHS0354_030150 [Potamilus streckersoni]|uniref:t-SNARE coiled-coil homology domain-containing protein n=1 Tax=Potamilus streckersoni TaxID=2493646 RepID=A0AAE0STQ0_9BIVA|nr:hypothetical protein CHS0354_030150 [Potamilus streckersoni]
MSRGTGYGSTQRPYFDDPSREYRDEPSGRYQDSSYSSFDTICDQISGNIFTVNNGANSIDRAMKIIGTDKDSPKLRDKIHETSQDTNNVIAKTTKLIKQLASMSQANKQQKLKLERIKNDFQECIQRFSTLQKRAADKVKKTVSLHKPAERHEPKDSAGWLDDDDDQTKRLVAQEEKRQQLLVQDQIIDDDLALIREREEQIRALEADVLDVNEIFRDLGAMIQQQGEQIDTIEANVEKAYTHVEEGTEQLKKAATYQKSSRKKMCILAIIFVIIAAIIAIILGTTLKK